MFPYSRSSKRRGFLFLAVAAWRGGKRLDCRRLVVQAYVCVNAQREPHVAVPSKCLGHLGRHVRPLEARDEQVAVGMEVGIQAVVVAIL